MLINKRLSYCTKLTNFLMSHPEDVAEFVTVVCDTVDLPSLEAIYQQIQDISKNPSKARNKAKEN